MKLYDNILFLDLETTGLSYQEEYPIEIAYKKVGEDTKEYSSLIRLTKGVEISEKITSITGITNEDVATGKDIEQVKEEIKSDFKNSLVVIHNASFDLGFLSKHLGIEPEDYICTYTVYSILEPYYSSSLTNIHARHVGKQEQTHRALDDVNMLESIFNKVKTLIDLEEFKNSMVQRKGWKLLYVPTGTEIIQQEDYKI